MTRNKLYSLLLIACLAGFIYLFYTIQKEQRETAGVCIIKNVTGYPCPSCGTTRAVALLLEGRIIDSLWLNPFGIIVALIMAIVPVWILADWILKKESFFKAYKKTESIIRKPGIAIVLILLVILNWIWNFYKNL